mmetsp:Transcript_11641/g.28624  ORF Transcript_11641/g.28624 Transcript_11641/m.28624 type:complete len:299 (+) Transcript_11641:899-1795(+)
MFIFRVRFRTIEEEAHRHEPFPRGMIREVLHLSIERVSANGMLRWELDVYVGHVDDAPSVRREVDLGRIRLLSRSWRHDETQLVGQYLFRDEMAIHFVVSRLGSHLMSLGTAIPRLSTNIDRTLLPTAPAIVRYPLRILQVERVPKVSRISLLDPVDILPPPRSVRTGRIVVEVSRSRIARHVRLGIRRRGRGHRGGFGRGRVRRGDALGRRPGGHSRRGAAGRRAGHGRRIGRRCRGGFVGDAEHIGLLEQCGGGTVYFDLHVLRHRHHHRVVVARCGIGRAVRRRPRRRYSRHAVV